MSRAKMYLGNLILCAAVALPLGLNPTRLGDFLILALVSAVGWAATLEI